ncbi:MAG: primase [Pseudomonadota bacterium]|jgi:DNA primase
MRIPRAFIDEVIARSDIVSIIDRHIGLKKAGKNYTACCPFHNEKTPSFSVNADKQFYHCFGCGASGNVISFLMEYSHLEFIEAIETLAQQQGLSVPYEDDNNDYSNLQNTKTLYEILNEVAEYYQRHLSAVSLEYLKHRGLTQETIFKCGLGFAPEGWDNLLQRFPKEKHSQLLATGMIVQKEDGKFYDRFRQRIMFPIHDARGRVVAFGGRVLDESKPKYLNSPETTIFHKSNVLYGLHWVKATKPKQIILVEGYMDVVVLLQYGITNAVATLGTTASDAHFSQLFREVGEVVCCFDGDAAGYKAAWRALETGLSHLRDGHQISFMFLPDGDDPDSLVKREGANGFQERLQQAQPLSTFLFSQLTQTLNLDTLESRAKLAESARPLLAKIPNGAYRELLTARLHELTGVIQNQNPRFEKKSPDAILPPNIESSSKTIPPLLRKILAFLIQNPTLAAEIHEREFLNHLSLTGMSLLVELLNFLTNYPQANGGMILEQWRGKKEFEWVEKLLLWEHPLNEEGVVLEFRDALDKLEIEMTDQQIQKLLQKNRHVGLDDDEKQQLKILLDRLKNQGR